MKALIVAATLGLLGLAGVGPANSDELLVVSARHHSYHHYHHRYHPRVVVIEREARPWRHHWRRHDDGRHFGWRRHYHERPVYYTRHHYRPRAGIVVSVGVPVHHYRHIRHY